MTSADVRDRLVHALRLDGLVDSQQVRRLAGF
jgi:hypothetical protein